MLTRTQIRRLMVTAALAIFVVACGSRADDVIKSTPSVTEPLPIITKATEIVPTVLDETSLTAVPGMDPQNTPFVVESLPIITKTTEIVPAVLYEYSLTDVPGMDPQTMSALISVTYAKNLFVTLTSYDLETTEIVPEAAIAWNISDDGLFYTFDIRTDIPWVYHDPATGETVQVTDVQSNPRFVTAYDFVYSIRRICDPNLGSYYSRVVGPFIKGCLTVLDYEDKDNIPLELIEAIGVIAIDAATLVIQLEKPTSFFLSMTPLWTFSATPEWVITEYGEGWTEAGKIVTSGRYVLHEWNRGVQITVLRNPFMPEDMWGIGNIDRVETKIVSDVVTGYALWLKGDVEVSAIPDAELPSHLTQFPGEIIQIPELGVFYIGFRMTKYPFDDIRVRRAFSAAFDREEYVQQVRQGQGLAMRHFAPPGIFGAPPIDQVGVGFDPDFAREQLAAAGFPGCMGFPNVTIMGSTSSLARVWIEFAQNSWEKHLGCSSQLIGLEQLPFAELLAAIRADIPDEQAPHMWTLSWFADYPDENNWVGDALWCGNSQNQTKRTCTAIDMLIEEARFEVDPDRRIALYQAIEEGFFGRDGEFPIAPIFLRLNYIAVHSWYKMVPPIFGGWQWYNYSIDVEAQSAARKN